MGRGLLMLIPLLAVAASIASLAFVQSSASRPQFSRVFGVDSTPARSSYFRQPVFVGSPPRPDPPSGEVS
jgi:hypothetical protein